MPSASLVSSSNSNGNSTSNMSSTEAIGSPNDSALSLACQTLEKKVRNLEKRKGKLDGYREDDRKGKELLEDQKSAVAKYDEVMQNLEFARDLQNQFRNFVTEEDRQVKKKAKKEGAERAKAETARLATILTFQKILAGLVSNSKAKDDLKKGENGAKKLSKDQLDDFDELLKITNINLDDTEKVNLTLADHLISLAEAKPRKVGKSTYKSMNELLNAIKESGYNPAADSPVAKVETPIKKSPKSAPPMTNGKVEHHEEVSPPKPPQQKQATPPQQQATPPQQQHQQQATPPAPQQQEVVPMPAAAVPVVQAAPVQPAAQAAAPPPQAQAPPPAQQAQQATPMFPPPPHMSFVPQAQAAVPPTQQPSINFLQESQIDMESPHMDPAVVMVHHTVPPPTTQGPPFNQIFIPPTTLAALQQQQQQHFGGGFLQQQQKQGAPAPGFVAQPQQQVPLNLSQPQQQQPPVQQQQQQQQTHQQQHQQQPQHQPQQQQQPPQPQPEMVKPVETPQIEPEPE